MREFTIKVEIRTDEELEKIESALTHGIVYGLDVRRVASPKNVKIKKIKEKK
jgi:hypothetical protein